VQKLPVVSGKRLLKFLSKIGYVIVRQRGSHIRMEKITALGKHKITIPYHREIAKGTLNDILAKVSMWNSIPKKKLIEMIKNI